MEKRFWLLICMGLLPFICGCARSTPVEEVTATSGSFVELTEFVPDKNDWTTWRGPTGNGIANSESAPVQWSNETNVRWKTPIPGRGHSSPTVVGDLVVVATALEDQQKQMVVAVDRETGELRWETALHEGGFPSERELHPKGTHANGTVVCDGERLFVAFLHEGSVDAYALDLKGEQVWETRLGSFRSKFGYAPSPCLYKSFVIFAADNGGGGYLVAVHRESGEVIWRKARGAITSYSSAIVANVAGKDHLLISGGDKVCRYDPTTGDANWSCPGTTQSTCGTIVWNESIVFAGGGHPDKQVIAVDAKSGSELWSKQVKAYEPSLLCTNDCLFAVTDDGIAYCWDAKTGDEHWKKRIGGGFSASPVLCNGNVYVSDLNGRTTIFAASPERFQQVTQNQLGDDTYASPTICNGEIFLRVGIEGTGSEARQEWLYCLSESN